jgi:hypothetical protein
MIVTSEQITGAVFLLGLAFGAGGYAFAQRANTKRINGLGGRLNRAVAALMHICPADQREEVFRIITFGDSKGRSS